jgi:hypothetical protein
MKKGVKTSEFWAVILTSIVAISSLIFDGTGEVGEDKITAMTLFFAGAVNAIYTLSRCVIKRQNLTNLHISPALKSNVKTSEFWVTLIMPIAAIVGAFTGVDYSADVEQVTIVMAALGTIIYGASRQTLKAANDRIAK